MTLKNLIVKGKYFQIYEKNSDINQIKNAFDFVRKNIIGYLNNLGYATGNHNFLISYANVEFYPMISESVINPKAKSRLSIFKPDPQIKNYHLEQLNIMKDGAPWHVNICIFPGDIYNKNDGLVIEITSEPAIVHKYQQLHYRPSLNQDDIDLIVYENEEFISRIAIANLLSPLEKPKPIGSFVKTQITEKLRAFNFINIANFLEKGRREVEDGKSENGLVTLRSAIELFFVEIIDRKGEKPAPQKDVNKNIDKLQGLGYIDSNTHNILMKIAYNGLYVNLSNVTHDRQSRDYFDSRFYFNMSEVVFDYVLERIIKLNIRTKI
jgi:hypothetical protein